MLDAYEKLQDIGKGSFGYVSKIRRISDGRILVWKELDYGKMNEKEKQQIVSEVNILRDLHHPNIVRYYDRCIDKKNLKIYIIMEYCQQGDLQQMIKKCQKSRGGETISEEFIWKIFSQLVDALYFCHRRRETTPINRGEADTGAQANEHKQQRILHRDIKPGNIFLDQNQDAKLGDFGLARVMNEESFYANTHVGTPYYMSPEQINEQKYNEKSDIWSLGCIVYEMATLRPPFKAQNQLALALKIKEGKYERIPSSYSDELWAAIQIMLVYCQKRRASIEDLMKLPRVQLLLKKKPQQPVRPTDDRLQKETAALRALEEKLRQKEVSLIEREKYVAQKEQFLNQKENELLNRERDLIAQCDERGAELGEKERLINKILQLQGLPTSRGDLKRTLMTIEQSQGSTATGNSGLGSISHQLKDSKFCSDSSSPLKSGSLNKEQTLQLLLNKDCGKASPNVPQTARQTISSCQQHAKFVSGQTKLKNNKSDPNLRSILNKVPASSSKKKIDRPPYTAMISVNNVENFTTMIQQKEPLRQSEESCQKLWQASQDIRQYETRLPSSTKNSKLSAMSGAGSPIEFLKRFKMQKRVSQKQQENIKPNAQPDDELPDHEQKDPQEMEDDEDNTMCQTVFNPQQASPNDILNSTQPEKEVTGRQQKLSSQAMLLKMMSKVAKSGDTGAIAESSTSNLQLATYRSHNPREVREVNVERNVNRPSVHSRQQSSKQRPLANLLSGTFGTTSNSSKEEFPQKKQFNLTLDQVKFPGTHAQTNTPKGDFEYSNDLS